MVPTPMQAGHRLTVSADGLNTQTPFFVLNALTFRSMNTRWVGGAEHGCFFANLLLKWVNDGGARVLLMESPADAHPYAPGSPAYPGHPNKWLIHSAQFDSSSCHGQHTDTCTYAHKQKYCAVTTHYALTFLEFAIFFLLKAFL